MNAKSNRHALFSATLIALTLSPAAQASDGWDWMVAPYAWFASTSTDVELPVPPPGGDAGDIEFQDIVDVLDGAFQIRAEGQGDDFGVMADFTYVGLADEKEFDRFDSESDLDARLFDLAAVWSPGEDRGRGFEVFAGLRYIDIDVNLQLTPLNPAFATTTVRGGDAYSDFLLGVRYGVDLSDRFGLMVSGDGSTGQTEGTWNFSAMGTYRMKNGAWVFGYRYMNVSLANDEEDIEMTMHGPVVGYAFRF